jgi:hypothetical protein
VSFLSLGLAVVLLFGLWPLIGGLHPFLVRHQVDVVVLTKS